MIGSKAWSSYSWREKDIFRPSQLKISINPSSVEGFFSGLSAVGLAYGGDLCPEGILGLSHADVIAILLGLIFFFLSLGFCLLCLNLRNLYCLVRGGALWSFRLFGQLMLTRRRRVLKLSILNWLGNCRSFFLLIGSKAWSSYG